MTPAQLDRIDRYIFSLTHPGECWSGDPSPARNAVDAIAAAFSLCNQGFTLLGDGGGSPPVFSPHYTLNSKIKIPIRGVESVPLAISEGLILFSGKTLAEVAGSEEDQNGM